MKQEHKVMITREDLINILAEKGVHIPAAAAILDGEGEYYAPVDFPISFVWEEKIRRPFSLATHIPELKHDMLKHHADGRLDRIALIKKVREITGWGLKESKDWTDVSFPRD